MKTGWIILLVVLVGLIGSAGLWLASSPPRGTPIQLLPPPTPSPFQVFVSGAVNYPGVYVLAAGERYQDAIQAAGGFNQDAITQTLNLAAPLQDGIQINVPSISDFQQDSTSDTPGTRGTTILISEALININTATEVELETLPGIGPVIAGEIIAYRQKEGDFVTIEDVQKVSGIGPGIFEKIKDLITVGQGP